MTRLLRCLLVVVFSVPLVWLTPAPAHACECVAPPGPRAALEADAVFIATFDAPLGGGDPPSGLTTTATVERVLKGEVGDSVTITTSSSSCGVFGLDAGNRWLVVENAQPDGSYGLSSCGNSGPASKRDVATAERVLGIEPVAAPATSEPAATDVDPDEDDDEDDDEPIVWLAIVSGGLAIAIGVAAYAWSRRRS